MNSTYILQSIQKWIKKQFNRHKVQLDDIEDKLDYIIQELESKR